MRTTFFVIGVVLVALNSAFLVNNLAHHTYNMIPVNLVGIAFAGVTIVMSRLMRSY